MCEPVLREGVGWPFTVVGLLSDLDPWRARVGLPAGAPRGGAFGDIVNDGTIVTDRPCVPHRGHGSPSGDRCGNGTLL